MPQITVNAEPRASRPADRGRVAPHLGRDPEKLAVEVNRERRPARRARDGRAERRRRRRDRHPGRRREAGTAIEAARRSASSRSQSRLFTGTGKYRQLRPDAAVHGGQRLRGDDRGRPPRTAHRQGGPQPPRLPRPEEADHPAEHRRVLHAPRTRSATPGWRASCSTNLGNPGADWVKLECLADKKTLLPDPIDTLKATEAAGEGGVHGPGLHHRRPDPGEATEGGRGGERDAGRQPDRHRGRGSSTRTTSASSWSTSRTATRTTR